MIKASEEGAFYTKGIEPMEFKGKNISYRGVRLDNNLLVTKHGIADDNTGDYNLDTRLDLKNHSPLGFETGYLGSGPAQLALAIIADYTENDNLALNVYQKFKEEVIAQLPDEAWIIRGRDIGFFLKEKGFTERKQR